MSADKAPGWEDRNTILETSYEKPVPIGWPAAAIWVAFFAFLSVVVYVVFG